ncbi:MAG: chorismate mutase [Alphaproteobacteria bacterium]|nr:chorismate mutase [Alphaproteobacteria bacterium]
MNQSRQKEIARLLATQRKKIDALDDKLMKLMADRFRVVEEVARIKTENDIPAYLGDRVRQVRERNAKTGKKYGIDPEFVRTLYTLVIFQSCAVEEGIKFKLTKTKAAKKKPTKKKTARKKA